VALALAVLGCASSAPRATLNQAGWDRFTLGPVPPTPRSLSLKVAEGANNDDKFAALVELFRTELAAQQAPGAALAVVIDGRLSYTSGIGVTRVGESDSVTSRTLFRVASTTKLFSAIAALTATYGAALGRLPLRGAATTRNWNTVLKLLEMLGG
jgi:CubicO group peptidase (beta-lactamase class C family)